MKIFIDAGHGGSETGAIAVDGTPEKDINLSVAKYLATLLTYDGFTVKMSREKDDTIPLKIRSEMANEFNPDLVISIHHNSFDKVRQGYEIIYSIKKDIGFKFAEVLSEEFSKVQKISKLFCKESGVTKGVDYYGIIRNTNAPTVITEYAYIDSQDYNKVNDYILHKLEATMIRDAVVRFFNVKLHWADKYFNILNNNGINISEKRFDDNITRGEIFALICKALKLGV